MRPLPNIYTCPKSRSGFARPVVEKRCRASVGGRGRGETSHQCPNLPKRWFAEDGSEVDRGTEGAFGFCLRCRPDSETGERLYRVTSDYKEPLKIFSTKVLRETDKTVTIGGESHAFDFKRTLRKTDPGHAKYLARTEAEAVAKAKIAYTEGKLNLDERLASVEKKLEQIAELEDALFPSKGD